MQSATFRSTDGQTITYYTWYPSGTPRSLVVIAHGMAEHPLRYNEFANFLCKHGCVVCAPAHRGHGATGRQANLALGLPLGYFADQNGWLKVVDDLNILIALIKKDYSDLPLTLFGHSMGSFLTRSYLLRYSKKLNGAILCGTAGTADASTALMRIMSAALCRLQGDKAVSPLLNTLVNQQNNRGIKHARTTFDWLSRDVAAVDLYIADADCGFPCTNGFFRDLADGWRDYSNLKLYDNISPELPLLLISGTADPVGNFGRGVKKSADLYRRHGLKDVQLKLWPEARHELLNEVNRHEIYQFVVDWLESRHLL